MSCFSGCFAKPQTREMLKAEIKAEMEAQTKIEELKAKVDELEAVLKDKGEDKIKLYSTGFSKVETAVKSTETAVQSTELQLAKVVEGVYQAGTKQGFIERRLMHGNQGYVSAEAFRQIANAWEEWGPLRSQTYFSGVIHNEYVKWINSSDGVIKPKDPIWR